MFGVGVVLTFVTWWPEPLLEWSFESEPGIIIDYAILTINVLAFDVLTFVLLPVLVIEQRSIASTLRRSVQFAARHPWRILAIDRGLWGIYFLFNEGLMQVYSSTDPEWANLVWSAMVVAWIIFNMAAGCAVIAAIYHLICNEHEGPAPGTLARVFD